jgi:hypothetical protein
MMIESGKPYPQLRAVDVKKDEYIVICNKEELLEIVGALDCAIGEGMANNNKQAYMMISKIYHVLGDKENEEYYSNHENQIT